MRDGLTLAAWLAGYHLLASGVCFALYARDKAAARAGQWRTPERTLLLVGLLGGWPGGWLGQRVLRHKSAKPSFRVWFWLSVVAHLALLTEALIQWG